MGERDLWVCTAVVRVLLPSSGSYRVCRHPEIHNTISWLPQLRDPPPTLKKLSVSYARMESPASSVPCGMSACRHGPRSLQWPCSRLPPASHCLLPIPATPAFTFSIYFSKFCTLEVISNFHFLNSGDIKCFHIYVSFVPINPFVHFPIVLVYVGGGGVDGVS